MATPHDILMEIRETCALSNLRKLSRPVTQIYEGLMAQSGITGPQFTTLVALSFKDEWTLTELANAVVVDRTTMTRNLAVMEKGGLIKVEVGPDRRERLITLAPKGRQTFGRSIPLWRKAQARMASILGKELLERFVEDLKNVSSALAKQK